MHRRKDLYGEDAEDFRPERWNEDLPLYRDDVNAAWGFLPFSGGPRVCLGRESSHPTILRYAAFEMTSLTRTRGIDRGLRAHRGFLHNFSATTDILSDRGWRIPTGPNPRLAWILFSPQSRRPEDSQREAKDDSGHVTERRMSCQIREIEGKLSTSDLSSRKTMHEHATSPTTNPESILKPPRTSVSSTYPLPGSSEPRSGQEPLVYTSSKPPQRFGTPAN